MTRAAPWRHGSRRRSIPRIPPNQAVPTHGEPGLAQPHVPPIADPDGGRVGEQAVLLLLRAQPGEPGVERVLGQQEGFLAAEDRRVGAAPVFEAVDWT